MSKYGVKERKREHYYKQSKKAGYRSRAAYKLIQINERHSVIKKGDTVIDLGAAPGGWSQVAKELVGLKGKVLAVDIQNIQPIEGVIFLEGDITKQESVEKILSIVSKADVIISDMSPNITGNYSMDHARSIHLAESALGLTKKVLRAGGNFVVKVFEGDAYKEFFESVRTEFKQCKAYTPDASRKSSSEIYVIGKRFLRRRW